MKNTIIKIGMTMVVLLFLCAATSWADGRNYNHHYNKPAYKAQPSKTSHYRQNRATHYADHHEKYYYRKRPAPAIVRHPIQYRQHHDYRPFHRYHDRHHQDNCYPNHYGFWMFWRMH